MDKENKLIPGLPSDLKIGIKTLLKKKLINVIEKNFINIFDPLETPLLK